jgi:hypothetical protein
METLRSVRRGSPRRFPAPRSEQILAHAERRCHPGCPFCRADREAQQEEQRLEERLTESLQRLMRNR